MLSYLIITFETAVLFGGIATFVGFFVAGRLPEPWNPLFEIDGFERASVDRFWLGVDVRDAKYLGAVTRADLLATGPLRTELLIEGGGDTGDPPATGRTRERAPARPWTVSPPWMAAPRGGGSPAVSGCLGPLVLSAAALLLGGAVLLAGCGPHRQEDRDTWGLERMVTQPKGDPYEAKRPLRRRRDDAPAAGRDRAAGRYAAARGGGDRRRRRRLGGGGAAAGRRRAAAPRPRALRDLLRRLPRSARRRRQPGGRPHGAAQAAVAPVASASASLAPGHVFAVASRGYGLMPGYAAVMSVEDRWAVVAYLEALQLSQAGVPLSSLPPGVQDEARQRAPELRQAPPAGAPGASPPAAGGAAREEGE